MCLLELSIIFVLAIGSSHLSQGQCTKDKCQATVSTVITIPCGDDVNPENDGIMFQYSNITDNSIDEAVLWTNTTYYRLNVTVYDDNTRIACRPYAPQLDSGIYLYTISILYPPQVIKPIPHTRPIEKKVTVDCPLDGNPLPVCSWEFYKCDYTTQLEEPSGIIYINNNCSFIIQQLTFEYLDMCFNCKAWNKLGNKSKHLLDIQFNACQAVPTLYITATTNTFIMGSNEYIEVQKGQDLNLTCFVTVISYLDTILWNTSNNESGLQEKDASKCLNWNILSFHNINSSSTDTYTCSVPYVDPPILNQSITVVVIDGVTSTRGMTSQLYVGISVAAVVSVLIVCGLLLIIVVVVIKVRIIYKRRQVTCELNDHLQYLMQPDLESYDETKYDIFLSFAEEDRSVAVSRIKLPLEEKGYSICWHHDAFMPGYTIIENMEKSIYESRVTIMILSKYFANSEFCMKELQIAMKKSEEVSNKECIIPVKLDELLSIIPELRRLTYVDINDRNLIGKICRLLALGMPQEIVTDL